MKTQQSLKSSSCQIEAKGLTLGNLISATYDAYGEKRAPKILKLAIESHLVRYKQTSYRGTGVS